MNFSVLSILLLLAAVCGLALSGCDRDGKYTTATFVLNSNSIYYPLCDEDDCDPIPASDRFPPFIFLTGGSVVASQYSNYASKVASHGYIVIVPTGFPSTAVLLRGKGNLTLANNDPASPIFSRLNTAKWSIGGHSVGGVTAIIAASNDAVQLCNTPPPSGLSPLCGGFQGFGDPVRAVFTYGTVLVERRFNPTNPTRVNTNTSGIPVALTRGSAEGNVLLEDYHWTFDNALETPKALFELDGANHYGITDLNNPPGATPETSPQARSQEWSNSKIARITTTFLKAHVNGKQAAFNKIYVDSEFGSQAISVLGAVAA